MNTDGSGSVGSPTVHRVPSETLLAKQEGGAQSKPWERSQSEIALQKDPNHFRLKSSSVDYTGDGSTISEHSRVYWDLSNLSEDEGATQRAGKVKISLQTIHQKEELKTTTSSPSVSVQARVFRRMASETSIMPTSCTTGRMEMVTVPLPLEASGSPPQWEDKCQGEINTTPTKMHHFSFSVNQGKPNLTVTLANAVPVMQENISLLQSTAGKEQKRALFGLLSMIESAWATPTIGRDLAYGLCDVLRNEGGLHILIQNCSSPNHEVKLGSAKVLEQCMTSTNRDVVAKDGLEIIVQLSKASKEDMELAKATTGILENLFKHSEDTCSKVIQLGGLDTILYSCRNQDKSILRHCAEALANLAMFGGSDNQYEMIVHKAPEWLFPLAFSDDDSIRYYALLAISALSANREIESAVVKSGTLELVQPFILTHDPASFALSDKAHIHGQSKEWLKHLVPLLESKREEARCLAAFHFAMEAGIKADQGKLELGMTAGSSLQKPIMVFSEIGAIEPLKRVASSTNKIASKFAIQALRIIGEEIPYKLTQQVPLWTTTDVQHWLQQTSFGDYLNSFKEYQVDGDLLLLLTEDNLKDDLKMTNGITRKRFMRELARLKNTAEYESCDQSKLDEWLRQVSPELSQYVYTMLKSGVDRRILRWLNEEHLKEDCGILNGVHRLRILEAAKRLPSVVTSPVGFGEGEGPFEKSIDVFISYRRSNGSQLASLLKVHLQLRGFTVFLDIEKLRAGKFDDNLLNSVRNARHFLIVLTPNSLDRCIGDEDQKDWVHREIVAALEGGCNIIPVMDNFQWPSPEILPQDMRPICYFNGIRWIHDYQDACVDKLEQFLTGEASVLCHPSLSKGSSLSSATEIHGPLFKMGNSQEGTTACAPSSPHPTPQPGHS